MLTRASTIRLDALEQRIAKRPAKVVGRVLLPELGLVPAEATCSVGAAFGLLDEEARVAWLQALASHALVLHFVAVPSEGMRGLFARFRQRASDGMALDEACTGLFRDGVRELQVMALESRRDLVVILGRKA